jgi:cysteine desulfurase
MISESRTLVDVIPPSRTVVTANTIVANATADAAATFRINLSVRLTTILTPLEAFRFGKSAIRDPQSEIAAACPAAILVHHASVRSVYFDYNATTPLDADVRAAMLPYMDGIYGNPSSVHHIGQKARAALDAARDRVASVLKSKPSEVVFTSGGTESDNLAVFGSARLRASQGKGRHLITSSIEHHAVLHCFQYLEKYENFRVTYLPVSSEGIVNPDDVRTAITPETTLVSVMAANNETGAIQPVAEIGRLCRERGVLFHTDAAQWFGKEQFENVAQFEADLVTICAHKFHGPKGAGALYIRSPLLPHSILFGGGHENERRAGTENLAAIIGLTEAMERFVKNPVFAPERLRPLTDRLTKTAAAIPGVQIRSPKDRLANTVSFTVDGCDSIALMAGLDLEGVCASSGSACSAGSLEPSHVLVAMGAPRHLANSFVRFSLGRESTAEEVDYVEKILPGVISRIRA